MNLDRSDLETARSALAFMSKVLAARNEPTAAFDCAAASIAEVLARSALGTPGPQPIHTEGYVDTEEAAKALRCSDRRVRNIAAGIGGIKIGGVWMIPRSSLPEPEMTESNE